MVLKLIVTVVNHHPTVAAFELHCSVLSTSTGQRQKPHAFFRHQIVNKSSSASHGWPDTICGRPCGLEMDFSRSAKGTTCPSQTWAGWECNTDDIFCRMKQY